MIGHIYIFHLIKNLSYNYEIKTNPSSWPGENGKGVEIPKEEEAEKNEKFKLNQFNILASDRIALNRTISDVRLNTCRRKRYPKHLPTASIHGQHYYVLHYSYISGKFTERNNTG
ncbi:hypothetical protein BLA29_005986 [Euroglyphus maynei]|uniref:Uncharacterized protein n=1 Tax=Euroglyphus maynei TaxID=6958 RepID=A0A1Y3BE70_EURMA|nr:hypothetical protein BLA29_005986 [Euroglyphus maynei]